MKKTELQNLLKPLTMVANSNHPTATGTMLLEIDADRIYCRSLVSEVSVPNTLELPKCTVPARLFFTTINSHREDMEVALEDSSLIIKDSSASSKLALTQEQSFRGLDVTEDVAALSFTSIAPKVKDAVDMFLSAKTTHQLAGLLFTAQQCLYTDGMIIYSAEGFYSEEPVWLDPIFFGILSQVPADSEWGQDGSWLYIRTPEKAFLKLRRKDIKAYPVESVSELAQGVRNAKLLWSIPTSGPFYNLLEILKGIESHSNSDFRLELSCEADGEMTVRISSAQFNRTEVLEADILKRVPTIATSLALFNPKFFNLERLECVETADAKSMLRFTDDNSILAMNATRV